MMGCNGMCDYEAMWLTLAFHHPHGGSSSILLALMPEKTACPTQGRVGGQALVRCDSHMIHSGL